MSHSGIAEIEGGRVKGTVDFIDKLSQATNTTISHWTEGENPENIKCYNHESLDVLIDSMIDTGIIKEDGKLNEMAQNLILKVLEKEIIQRIEKNKRDKK
ncbi:XRE family transcriptional regulator [Clostridium pasteurianum]|nr:XRE family transcriptional regulator [Clostridium pasteurianum]